MDNITIILAAIIMTPFAILLWFLCYHHVKDTIEMLSKDDAGLVYRLILICFNIPYALVVVIMPIGLIQSIGGPAFIGALIGGALLALGSRSGKEANKITPSPALRWVKPRSNQLPEEEYLGGPHNSDPPQKVQTEQALTLKVSPKPDDQQLPKQIFGHTKKANLLLAIYMKEFTISELQEILSNATCIGLNAADLSDLQKALTDSKSALTDSKSARDELFRGHNNKDELMRAIFDRSFGVDEIKQILMDAPQIGLNAWEQYRVNNELTKAEFDYADIFTNEDMKLDLMKKISDKRFTVYELRQILNEASAIGLNKVEVEEAKQELARTELTQLIL